MTKKKNTMPKWLPYVIFAAIVVFSIYSTYRLDARNQPTETTIPTATTSETTPTSKSSNETTPVSTPASSSGMAALYSDASAIDVSKLPDNVYAIPLNNGVPYFTDEELTLDAYEYYSPLDNLGRCGYAMACITTDLQPAAGENRDSISSVKPSGWKSYKADDVDGGWLYNRSHLIGWQLTAENANKLNLITGTRQFNVDGMLPQEMAVANVLKDYPGIHIMYRVTPIYSGNNLVANGVVMEAFSVDDNGSAISFCFFIPNTQKGWTIDYATGKAKQN